MNDCATSEPHASAALHAAVDTAHDMHAVLDGVVAALMPHVKDLLRASVRLVAEDDPTQVEIVALWSAVPTDLVVGLRMPVRSTSLPDVILSGSPEIRDDVNPETGILDAIVRDEGVHSFVSLPLRHQAKVVGLLSFSSSHAGAFSLADLPLLVEAADLVSSRLAQSGPPAQG